MLTAKTLAHWPSVAMNSSEHTSTVVRAAEEVLAISASSSGLEVNLISLEVFCACPARIAS